MWVWFLGWEDPLEESMASYSSIIVWRNLWTEEPGRGRRVNQDRSDLAHTHLQSNWMFGGSFPCGKRGAQLLTSVALQSWTRGMCRMRKANESLHVANGSCLSFYHFTMPLYYKKFKMISIECFSLGVVLWVSKMFFLFCLSNCSRSLGGKIMSLCIKEKF